VDFHKVMLSEEKRNQRKKTLEEILQKRETVELDGERLPSRNRRGSGAWTVQRPILFLGRIQEQWSGRVKALSAPRKKSRFPKLSPPEE